MNKFILTTIFAFIPCIASTFPDENAAIIKILSYDDRKALQICNDNYTSKIWSKDEYGIESSRKYNKGYEKCTLIIHNLQLKINKYQDAEKRQEDIKKGHLFDENANLPFLKTYIEKEKLQ